jgi:prephenate dehydratase
MARLAYLGPPGTFSEEAASRYQPGADLLPCPSEAAVAAAVESGEAGEGVLAIENSLEGLVTRTLDVLLHDASSLSIKHEVVLPVEHCLIVRPGTKREAITAVFSHPQSLNQCRKYLEANFPRARQEAALSNAAAVEEAVQVEGAAAIGPERAARLHGGEVLERAVQDSPDNKTRFVVVGHEDAPRTGRDKTSLAFAVAHDQPGTLVDALREFSDRGINLTEMASRPSRRDLGLYIFLIDMEGHRTDAPVAEALAAVEKKAMFFRLLGSYPRSYDAGNP